MSIDPISLWWENITGPQRLIERMAALLAEGRSVVLVLDELPAWIDQMRDYVGHRISPAQIWWMEWTGPAGRGDIGPRILEEVSRQHLALCPPQYAAQQTYLKNERVLANTVVWITGGEAPGDLARFVSDYRGGRLEDHGAFVLEVRDGKSLPNLSSSVEVLRCGDYITPGDVRLFSSILASARPSIPAEVQEYAACVTANLAGLDAELAAELISRADFVSGEPDQALLDLRQAGFGGEGPTDPEVLRQLVWKSQMQVSFAGIELERLRLASVYADQIQYALDTEYWDPQKNRSGYVTQHDDELEGPADVELGTMVRMMNLRVNAARERRLLSIPDQGDRDLICFLKECRNGQAHHRACSPEQMFRLLRVCAGERT